jgi:hypothetical protein
MCRQQLPGAGVITTSVRRRGRRGLAAALCALAAACSLAACSSASSTPAVSAGLLQRIEAAQDPVGYFVRTTAAQGSGPDSVTVAWTDLATGNAMLQRGSGSAKVANWERDYYDDRILHWDQTQVNYGPRTWWTADEHAASPVTGPLPAGPAGGGYTPGALVAEVLAKTPGTIIGYPVVDGRHTIELAAAAAGSQFQFWVDSGTYQVIRTAKYLPSEMKVPPLVSDYDWVRATAALVNLVDHPQVPASFARVQVGQYYANS